MRKHLAVNLFTVAASGCGDDGTSPAQTLEMGT